MKKTLRNIAVAALALVGMAFASCSDTKSYAELLNDETMYVNAYLANQCVVAEVPADTVFKSVKEFGDDAPYYRLDEDGYLYMQVIDPGTPDNKVESDELIYFRFTRYSLYRYSGGELTNGVGNETDLSFTNTSFRYGNYQLQSSSQWGSGIQYPLSMLPVDCEINLIIKSQYGLTDEIAQVVPYLYHLRYYRPKI